VRYSVLYTFFALIPWAFASDPDPRRIACEINYAHLRKRSDSEGNLSSQLVRSRSSLDDELDAFFNRLSPCDAWEFLESGPIPQQGVAFGLIPIQSLDSLSGEVVRPTAFNRHYRSPYNRPNFRNNLSALVGLLRRSAVENIHVETISRAASHRYQSARG
jgi:hypothetical protein